MPRELNWSPRYIITKAPGIEGDPIPEDEPCLVVRGQDTLALTMLTTYRRLYEALPDHDLTVANELRRHWSVLLRWQANHPDRIKTADRPVKYRLDPDLGWVEVPTHERG